MNFPQNASKYSLAVCGSLWGEKQFLLEFVPFTGLIKNSCLNKSKFYSGFTLFKHFLSISVLSEIVMF